ncbi:hypothetical protein Y032_0008g172 [Ancylostoma ceylanicum]|uniref:Uncharacterized protein n=1 Tax=Ancylostoma ceylanicum TaxID=53326 RepID=A0A016VKE4_9BILA|nr:hypothetical protein Y032_0008g172 [Ancylostoma ceylanicum]
MHNNYVQCDINQSSLQYAQHVIPITVLSFFFAFIWSILFEVPTARIESLLLTPRGPSQQQKTTSISCKEQDFLASKCVKF